MLREEHVYGMSINRSCEDDLLEMQPSTTAECVHLSISVSVAM